MILLWIIGGFVRQVIPVGTLLVKTDLCKRLFSLYIPQFNAIYNQQLKLPKTSTKPKSKRRIKEKENEWEKTQPIGEAASINSTHPSSVSLYHSHASGKSFLIVGSNPPVPTPAPRAGDANATASGTA